MNRAMRRRATRKKLTEEDYQELIAEIEQAALQATVHAYTLVVALTLRDELGFGKTRLNRFMARVHNNFEAINGDYITLKDIEETLEEECNFVIR